jgi:hypothetical protein
MYLNEMICEDVEWIYLGQMMVKRPIFVSMKMNIPCFTGWATFTLSRKILPCNIVSLEG